MKKKMVGFFIFMLFVATTLPVVGILNKTNNQLEDLLKSEFVPDEFIVKFKDTTILNQSFDNLNEKYHVISIEKIFKNSENTILDNIYLLNVPKYFDVFSIVNDYSMCQNIEYAEPNYIIHLGIIKEPEQLNSSYLNRVSSNFITNDPDFNKQWPLDNTGQYGGTPDADIDAQEAWEIETGSSDVVIAIVDSGVDYTHPDLSDNIWINDDEIPNNKVDDDGNDFIDDIRGWNFIQDNNDPLDGQGHGTLCSGVAAAVDSNGIGIVGVCCNCKIMTIKTMNKEGYGTWSGVSQGIRYAADNGADVISMSFGGYNSSCLLKDVVDYAYSKGIVLVAAAGNEGVSDKLYPAGYDNVIAVASTNNNDNRMDNVKYGVSNYGDWIDVAAPGANIFSTMPTYHVFFNDWGYKKDYDYSGGTSYACPHVAGLAALILSRNSSLSPEEVKSIICENVDPYYSEYYLGIGRINAFKTLNEHIIPPDKPETPSGPKKVHAGTDYTYSTSTTDPQGDKLYYMWNWGDKVNNWIGPIDSGDIITCLHNWTIKEDYEIKVKAKNIGGAESEWSDPLIVSMPKTKAISTPFLTFLENHLHLFPLIWQILGL